MYIEKYLCALTGMAQLVRGSPNIHKGWGFDPRSGHIQESTNECINNWNNKLMSLSPPPSSLSGNKPTQKPQEQEIM